MVYLVVVYAPHRDPQTSAHMLSSSFSKEYEVWKAANDRNIIDHLILLPEVRVRNKVRNKVRVRVKARLVLSCFVLSYCVVSCLHLFQF